MGRKGMRQGLRVASLDKPKVNREGSTRSIVDPSQRPQTVSLTHAIFQMVAFLVEICDACRIYITI